MGGLARRLAFAPVVLVAVAASMFAILRVLRPDLYPGETVVPGVLHDLDRALLHLDFGCSGPKCSLPVRVIWQRGVWGDLWLLSGALVIGVGGGALAGLWCAGHPRALGTKAFQVAAALAYCAPVYFVGLTLLYLFNPDFGLVPLPAFFDAEPHWSQPFTNPWMWLRTYLLPWLVLAAPLAGMCLRLTLATAREVRQEDYVRTALAKGLESGDVMRRHVGPPSFGATVSFAGVLVPLFIFNLALVEKVFSVPGFFFTLWAAVGHNREGAIDLPIITAVALWATVLVIALGLLSDALLGRLDPRVRDAAF